MGGGGGGGKGVPPPPPTVVSCCNAFLPIHARTQNVTPNDTMMIVCWRSFWVFTFRMTMSMRSTTKLGFDRGVSTRTRCPCSAHLLLPPKQSKKLRNCVHFAAKVNTSQETHLHSINPPNPGTCPSKKPAYPCTIARPTSALNQFKLVSNWVGNARNLRDMALDIACTTGYPPSHHGPPPRCPPIAEA